MSRLNYFLLFLLLLTPTFSFAETNNAGFVQGLWYSEDILLVDEPTRIYAAVRNNTGADLSGTVRFSINGDVITTRRVTALDGRIIETWADWTPTYGEHAISAELSRIELSTVGGDEEEITVVAALAEDVVFVDRDTDTDGIPNESDTDDDNDGISDEDETKAGTDPLDAASPAPEPEAIEEPTEESGAPENKQSRDTISRENSDGLERYLTPSRAETMLSNITDWTNNSKRAVDTFRISRADTLTVPSSTAPVQVDENGFGEITRRDATSPAREYEGADSFVQTFVDIIATFFSAVFTGVLALLSFVLSYPMLVQIALLLLLLIIILRIARFFGRRPN